LTILVDEKTKVVVQGITGREATTFTRDMLDYGTHVVAGVVPGKEGQLVHDVPVYDCVVDAVKKHDANTSVVSVPPRFAKDAALEAIDAGIELVVVFTERVPRRDVVEVLEYADEKGTRIVGPNSLGIISPGVAKVCAIGGPAEDAKRAYKKGFVGIISRSGGMTTEVANLLTMNGIGQSTCVSIGGDPILGSTFAEILPLFGSDPQTKAVVLFCEPGGAMEEDAASYIREVGYTKPVIAFVAGRFVDTMPGTRFGHAGVIVDRGRGRAEDKIRALKEAGAVVVEDFSDIAIRLREALRK